MKTVAIAGSAELSKRLIDYFENTGFARVVGMFDDYESADTTKHDRPVLGNMNDIPAFFKKQAFDSVAIGVGYRHRGFRKEIFEFLKARQVPVTTFAHPTAHIEPSATIMEGSIVLIDCTIDARVRLHENVFVSSRCFLSHDVWIRAHTYCAPAINLAGRTEVGERCFLGIATTTVDGIRIGENVQTAAGAVITKDVPADVLVAGVPAVVKGRNKPDSPPAS
jgi:sugar O-acyltransferase (sialic acid O-acetyltransferase NeuD family)